MNTTTMRTLIAAVALVVAATASAQTFKAEVPMAFQVAGKTMNPGTYEVRMSGSGATEVVALYDHANGDSAMTVAGINVDAPKAWRAAGDPKISFTSQGGKYYLSTVWTGDGPSAHQVLTPKSSKNMMAKTEVVTLAMVRVR